MQHPTAVDDRRPWCLDAGDTRRATTTVGARQRQCDSEVGVHADMVSMGDCSPRRTARACGPPARARIQTHPDSDGRGRGTRPRAFFLTRAPILYWNPVLIQDVPDFPEFRHPPTCIIGRCDDLCTPTSESHCDGLARGSTCRDGTRAQARTKTDGTGPGRLPSAPASGRT